MVNSRSAWDPMIFANVFCISAGKWNIRKVTEKGEETKLNGRRDPLAATSHWRTRLTIVYDLVC